jgi:hypothetical protein
MDQEGADRGTLGAGGGGAGVGGQGGIGARHGGGWQLVDGSRGGCGGQEVWRRQGGDRAEGAPIEGGVVSRGRGDREEVQQKGSGVGRTRTLDTM